jgi:hypothetical protein
MSFRLFDLQSQAVAVQRELLGASESEKLEGPYGGCYL